MRLLYVSNGSNFLGAGGMEYHLVDVARELKRLGVAVGFAVREGTFFHKEMLKAAEDVFPMSITGPIKAIYPFQLLRAMVLFRPDIVSINREKDVIQTYWVARIYNGLFGGRAKIVSVFHNLGWRKKFDLGLLDGTIFPNEHIRNDYPGAGAISERSATLYHGIDIGKFPFKSGRDFRRGRRCLKGTTGPVIGMVGELRKNQLELIDVAVHLKKRIDEFTFVVVGRGSQKEVQALEEKIASKGLDRHFILTGNVPRENVPDYYDDFDVSVTTNRHEPFGIVFIESLASGTPLVAYDSGGPVEVLAHGGGFLVSGGPEEMADRLDRLLSDGGELERVGAEGREVAERFFSLEAMGRAHHGYYSSLMSRPKGEAGA